MTTYQERLGGILNSMVCDIRDEAYRAEGRLGELAENYQEGWEDEALDVVIGFRVFLQNLTERAEWLMCDPWAETDDGGILEDS